jgi:hypothetical protein
MQQPLMLVTVREALDPPAISMRFTHGWGSGTLNLTVSDRPCLLCHGKKSTDSCNDSAVLCGLVGLSGCLQLYLKATGKQFSEHVLVCCQWHTACVCQHTRPMLLQLPANCYVWCLCHACLVGAGMHADNAGLFVHLLCYVPVSR